MSEKKESLEQFVKRLKEQSDDLRNDSDVLQDSLEKLGRESLLLGSEMRRVADGTRFQVDKLRRRLLDYSSKARD